MRVGQDSESASVRSEAVGVYEGDRARRGEAERGFMEANYDGTAAGAASWQPERSSHVSQRQT